MKQTTTDGSQAQEEARQIARVKLKRYATPDIDQIRDACAAAKRFVEADADAVAVAGKDCVDLDSLVQYFVDVTNMYVRPAQLLKNPKGHEDWLPRRRSEIPWNFWTRYQAFLEHIEDLPQPVVNAIDAQTETVLDLLEDPTRTDPWDRRGLVVGSVQSGKTGNFMGLACKALDAGYKLIIILAGIHNSLRTQTQIRMEEAVLGFNTESNLLYDIANEKVGVGTLKFPDLHVNSLTSRGDNGDFKADRLNATYRLGNDPFIIVVKKNARILENLRRWLLALNGVDRPDGTRIIRNVPMLMIDDEADHSSINTRKPPHGVPPEEIDPARINGLIRGLLSSFERRAYVGFTATPFANIFVDSSASNEKLGDDIFPRSFILSLSAPPNYVGVEQVFGRAEDPDNGIEGSDGYPICRTVTDFETAFPRRYTKEFQPERLPESLVSAMQGFILSCTAREARGQTRKHNSMLVHVARYTQVQHHVTRLVAEQLRFFQRRIEQETGDGDGTIRRTLRELWETDFMTTTVAIDDPACPEMAWEEIAPFLLHAALKITVMEINGESADVLDYSRKQDVGISVIAVGGDKLSRGLTLYGLTVSYYMRVSRMYDSLLQMGRWFGYRDGYVDLCRIYTTTELIDWYRHIALADAELRDELARMVALRATPEDYGLRVRTHPQGMLVTALNKSRFSRKMRLSYAGTVTQSVQIAITPESIEKNHEAVRTLGAELGTHHSRVQEDSRSATPSIVWERKSAAPICRLLRTLVLPTGANGFDGRRIADFIEKQASIRELTSWTVALISTRSGTQQKPKVLPGVDIRLVARQCAKHGEVVLINNSNVLNPPDQGIDLRGREMDAAWISELLDKSVFAAGGDEAVQEERQILSASAGRDAWAVALEISQRRFDVAKAAGKIRLNQKRPDTVPLGAVMRDLRSAREGLFLIYPLSAHALDPSIADGETVYACVVSFPSSARAAPVEYQVNDVYNRLMLEQLEFIDDGA